MDKKYTLANIPLKQLSEMDNESILKLPVGELSQSEIINKLANSETFKSDISVLNAMQASRSVDRNLTGIQYLIDIILQKLGLGQYIDSRAMEGARQNSKKVGYVELKSEIDRIVFLKERDYENGIENE